MSKLLEAMLRPYMKPADDEGGDLPGGTPVDRGDAVEPDDAPAAEAPDDKVGDFVDKKDEDKENEPARDEGGKFAKKDRGVPDHVPKSRFDDAVGKERQAREAAEARAAELESRLRQEAKSVDVQKLEDKVEELEKAHAKYLLDGESEKAAAAMKEIRHTERYIARMESDESSSRATAQAVEQVRMESTIASLEAAYPTFNPESESFDQDLVDIVLAEQARLIQTERMAPSKALQTAATKIMNKFAPKDEAPAAKGLAAAKGDDRKKDQVAKNLDTARRQPESMRSTGKDSDKAGEGKIDVSTLSAAEFAALPDSTKARLRGDIL